MRDFRIAYTGDFLNLEGKPAHGNVGTNEFDAVPYIKYHFIQELAPHRDDPTYYDRLYSLDPARPDYAVQRDALEKDYLDLRRARIDAAVPGAASAAIITPDELARRLPKKTVLFEYALGDSATLLWVIDRDTRELHMLTRRAVIEPAVRAFRDAVA